MICDDLSCGQLTRDVPSVPQRGASLCVCKRGHVYSEVRGGFILSLVVGTCYGAVRRTLTCTTFWAGLGDGCINSENAGEQKYPRKLFNNVPY